MYADDTNLAMRFLCMHFCTRNVPELYAPKCKQALGRSICQKLQCLSLSKNYSDETQYIAPTQFTVMITLVLI